MPQTLYTGFHAIEEKIRSIPEGSKDNSGMKIFYSKAGPRVKKIIAQAKKAGVTCSEVQGQELDQMVKNLPAVAQDHRGIVLTVEGAEKKSGNFVDFDHWLAENADSEKRSTVVVLDSVTDPHNVGAILRSADQFGAALVVVPDHRGMSDISGNDVIARASAGAYAWVPVAVVKNLVRTVQLLKEKGFWVYGADAGGASVQDIKFPKNTAIVMGSEGTGMAKLLSEQCDTIVSIPTCGKIDSLNVSVAAGVLLYEVYRQSLSQN